MIYLLLFHKPSLRFIQGHALAHLWYPVDVYFRRCEHFALRLQARPFSGLVYEADYPPIFILMFQARLESSQFGFVYFYKVNFWHLGPSEKYWGLCSVLEFPPLDLCVCDFFGGLQSCHQIHCQYPQDLLKLFCMIFSDISAIISGLLMYGRSYGGVMAGLYSLVLPIFLQVSKCIGSTDSWLRAVSWELFSLHYVFVIPWRRMAWWDLLPSLLRDLFCSCLYPCSVIRRELNRANRKMMLVMFFGVLITNYLVTMWLFIVTYALAQPF